MRRRKKITCSFSEKNDRFGHCFRIFNKQVIFFQPLNDPYASLLPGLLQEWDLGPIDFCGLPLI